MTVARPEGIDPKYLKLSYQKAEGPVSRRDLLFGPLTPRYEVVPAVEEEACTAWKGCTQCLTVCPQQAIAIDGSAAAIDKAKCISCGACLPVCPVGAIRQPLLNPERLEAELKTLLAHGEAARELRILLLVADGGSSPDELKSSFSLRLPSIGAVSPWLLLKAFTLGADGIAIIPCQPGCRHRCDLARWERTLRFTRDLLTRFGIEAERLGVVAREEVPLRLNALREAVAGLGPHPQAKSGGAKVREALTMADLLKGLVALTPTAPAPLAGAAIPFGIARVRADRCTLCGACPERCPASALTLHEDDDSSRLLFDHACCIACEACVKVCPEGAVELERRLEFSRLGTPAILAEDQIARCQRCGAPVAPQSMLRKIGRSLPASRRSAGMFLSSYCHDCRILASHAPTMSATSLVLPRK